MCRTGYTIAMDFDQGVFKAYDIRGVYPSEIDGAFAYAIGKAFASLLIAESPDDDRTTIAVGADMRRSSPALAAKLIEGITESGFDVDDLGLVSTPTFYFGIARFGYRGGIQVSASHNPKEWNGFKIVRGHGVAMNKDTGLLALKDIMARSAYVRRGAAHGVVRRRDGVLAEEVRVHSEEIGASRIAPLTVVADPGNGMGALDLEALFAQLPCTLVKMNWPLDGSFPAHEPDPAKPKNLEALQARVREERADLGIATDGDADRLFFVDERGSIVPSHILRAMLAEWELAAHPGAAIAYDLRPGKAIESVVASRNARPIVTRVGSSIIKEIMLREGAVFGAELSGHYFYRMPYGTFEAPMISILKMLAMLSLRATPLSALVAPYLRYAHSGDITLPLGDPADIPAKLHAVETAYADGLRTKLDGISIEYPEFWFNVRPSNTEPFFRVSVEAITPEVLAAQVAKLKEILGAERVLH